MPHRIKKSFVRIIGFIEFRNYAFIFSFSIMLFGVFSYFYNKGFNYSIDFSGGIQTKIDLHQETTIAELKSILNPETHIISLGDKKRFLLKFVINENKIKGDSLASEFLKYCLSKLSEKYPKITEKDFTLKYIESTGLELLVNPNVENRLEINQILGDLFKVEENSNNDAFQIGLAQALNIIWIIEPLKAVYKEIESLEENIYEPMQGQLIKHQSFLIFILVLVLLLSYIGFRFEFKFGIISIITLLHDVFVMLSIILILKKDLDTSAIIAILTIIGYSLNDTIIVFDRIRENHLDEKALSIKHYGDIINKSIVQSLNRTLITSFTTLLVVIPVLILGGESLSNLSFILLIGIIVGTYSSIFIASPILYIWEKIKLYKQDSLAHNKSVYEKS